MPSAAIARRRFYAARAPTRAASCLPGERLEDRHYARPRGRPRRVIAALHETHHADRTACELGQRLLRQASMLAAIAEGPGGNFSAHSSTTIEHVLQGFSGRTPANWADFIRRLACRASISPVSCVSRKGGPFLPPRPTAAKGRLHDQRRGFGGAARTHLAAPLKPQSSAVLGTRWGHGAVRARCLNHENPRVSRGSAMARLGLEPRTNGL